MKHPDRFTEMVCHPGTYIADIEKPGSCARFKELQFLLSDDFDMLVKDSHVDLTTFWSC
jgi:hypothetical protein